jgi:hypothetical protein
METLVHYGMQVQKMYEAFKMGDIPTVLSGLSRDVIWEVMGQPDVPFAGIITAPTASTRWPLQKVLAGRQ